MKSGIFLFLLFCALFLNGQVSFTGDLPVRNFSKKEYNGGTQNWEAAQSASGLFYFANNEGLLEYDGVRWQKHPLPNRTIVRSLAIDGEKIYVGGQGEAGWFAPAENGTLRYYSLTEKVPEAYRNFSDVWDILVQDDAVLFRTNRHLFQWRGETMRVYDSGGPIYHLGVMNDTVYVHDAYQGLLRFDGEKYELTDYGMKPESEVTAFLPFQNNTHLISTLKGGFYIFDGRKLEKYADSDLNWLKNRTVYSAKKLPDGRYAFGLLPDGLLLTDENLQQQKLIGRKEGLQNSIVLAVGIDAAGNLWLGTDNGIDYVEVNSPYTYLYPDGDLEGTGYTAAVKDSVLYLGNSNGLYYRATGDFAPVAGAEGQVWGLYTEGNDLLLGSHTGAFAVDKTTVRRFYEAHGTWDFVRLDATHILAGHYGGMTVFRQSGNNWERYRNVENLKESSRILAKASPLRVWMAHPYRGVYRVDFNTDFTTKEVRKYGAADGLPSDNLNHAFRIRNEVLFAGESGVYRYDAESDKFAEAEGYNDILEKYGRIKMLKEDAAGNVWFAAGETVGRLLITNDGLNVNVDSETFPEMSGQLTGGFEFVYPYDKNNVIFGAEKGFIHFNPEKYNNSDFNSRVLLRAVYLTSEQDSLLRSGTTIAEIPELSSAENSLRFVFGTTSYRNPEAVEFQVKLEGLSDRLSEWTTKSEREYQNLRHGDYTFSVRARNAAGVVSEFASLDFTIRPPWYLTAPAYFLYAVIGLGLLLFVRKRETKKIAAAKNDLQNEFEAQEKRILKRAEASEIELNRVRREQLETEVAHQNQELATATLHLLQKREILTSLKSDLNKVVDKIRNQDLQTRDVQKIVRTIERDLESDSEWDRFAHHFNRVHQGFVDRLREKYANLSPTDLKLCAYLRMNLSSKEIAPLMAISVRGVEAGRYRLRKKMELKKEDNLQDVILGV